jgi:hypothetical protein
MNETDEHQTLPESNMEIKDEYTNQEASKYTDGIIRDAIASGINLRTMIDSLNAGIMNISDEYNSLQHVLGAYETFFGTLQKELEKQNIEKVLIGEALPDGRRQMLRCGSSL